MKGMVADPTRKQLTCRICASAAMIKGNLSARRLHQFRMLSNVESEVQDVALVHHVILPL
jgi:hypothetical protein